MVNRICDVQIINHRLDPHETELRIVVEVEELTPTTQIKGRLMGPRNVHRSTVEVAYPLRPVGQTFLSAEAARRQECLSHLEFRVIIPEASWWEPKTPFLYEGPVELWQDGVLCDRREISHGIRTLQMTANGLRLNGRPFVLRGKAVELPFDETRAREWHDNGINTLFTDEPGLAARADRFGFFVMGEADFRSFIQVAPDLR